MKMKIINNKHSDAVEFYYVKFLIFASATAQQLNKKILQAKTFALCPFMR